MPNPQPDNHISSTPSNDGDTRLDSPETQMHKDNRGLEELRKDFWAKINADFSFELNLGSATPESWPLPCISVDGIGIIGLPLSHRDGQLLMRKGYESAASGGVPPRPVEIRFLNPKWERFMNTFAAQGVCEGLKLPPGTLPPTLKFRSLGIGNPHSTYSLAGKPNIMPDQRTRPFATVAVILPSFSSGSTLNILHERKGDSYSLTPPHFSDIMFWAWYNDVGIKQIRRVTTGYQMILWYDVYHNTPHLPIPHPRIESQARTELRNVLLKWKAGDYNGDIVPKKLVYHSQERHPDLEIVAAQLGFQVLSGLLHFYQYGRSTSDHFVDAGSASRDPTLQARNARELQGTGIDVQDVSALMNKLCNLSTGLAVPGELWLELTDFMWDDMFEGEAPDNRECDEYRTGTVDLMFFFSRRVMLLIHPDFQVETIKQLRREFNH